MLWSSRHKNFHHFPIFASFIIHWIYLSSVWKESPETTSTSRKREGVSVFFWVIHNLWFIGLEFDSSILTLYFTPFSYAGYVWISQWSTLSQHFCFVILVKKKRKVKKTFAKQIYHYITWITGWKIRYCNDFSINDDCLSYCHLWEITSNYQTDD